MRSRHGIAVGDRVEHEVLGRRHRGEERGVAEQHVMQLVHHQHQEFLGRRCVALHEPGVDEKPRLGATLDAGGRDTITFVDEVSNRR